MPDTQEDIIRLNLEQERREYQEQQEIEADKNTPEVKRMGWGVLVGGILLTLLQVGLDWVADATAATGAGIIVSALIWVGGAGISVLLYFMLKPYRESIKEIRFWVNLSLVLSAIPLIDSIPFDLIGISYAFVKSRSHIVQKLSSLAGQARRIIPHLPKNTDKEA